MFNSTLQTGSQCSDTCSDIILGTSVGMFLNGTDYSINGLSRLTCLMWVAIIHSVSWKSFFVLSGTKKKNAKYYFFSCLLEHFMEFFLPLTSRWKSLCEISSLPPFRMQFKWTALLGPRPSPPVGAVLGFPVSVACQLTFLRILSLYNVRREFLVFNPPSQLGPGQILLQPLCASQPLEHFTAQQEGFFSLLLFFKSTIQESL